MNFLKSFFIDKRKKAFFVLKEPKAYDQSRFFAKKEVTEHFGNLIFYSVSLGFSSDLTLRTMEARERAATGASR